MKKEDASYAELEKLRAENKQLRQRLGETNDPVVFVPKEMAAPFEQAAKIVSSYFRNIQLSPSNGSITIAGERYVLLRASALSHEFLESISHHYMDKGISEAYKIGRNLLFDLAKVIGMEDARAFHKRMNLKEPLDKLSAGPVHFAFTGWGNVDILPESNPKPNADFFLRYHHPYSFEADAWIRSGKQADFPVCIMNSGYSCGWCEASFDVPLTAVEVSCKAHGDEHCTFVMSHPDKIRGYLDNEQLADIEKIEVPTFFERKKVEEQLLHNLKEKEVLIKEIHHRVKNNLQIISSLLNLQSSYVSDEKAREKFFESMDRIKTMALTHEMLYSGNKFTEIDACKYLRSISDSLKSSYSIPHKKIDLELVLPRDPMVMDIERAIPFGLIVNELLTNALKHAFSNCERGSIKLKLEQTNKSVGSDFFELAIKDDGIGFDYKNEAAHSKTLGLQLVRSLCEQIDAEIAISVNKGVEYRIQCRPKEP